MGRITQKKLENLSKGFRVGGSAFFKRREDSTKFANVLRKKGLKIGRIRSSGPTVGTPNKRTINAFGIVVTGKKRITTRKPTRRRIINDKFNDPLFLANLPAKVMFGDLIKKERRRRRK